MRVLNLEGNPLDSERVRQEIQRGFGDIELTRVETPGEFAAVLDQGPWDLVVADHGIPPLSSLAALAILRASGRDTPLIVVSGVIGLDFAVEAMRAGARDFLAKSDLSRLNTVVARELREAAVRTLATSRHVLTGKVLQTLNGRGELTVQLQSVLDMLRRHAGADAAGIRLRVGDDFPYAVQTGFDEAFLDSESSLRVFGGDCTTEGTVVGSTELSCLCGAVLLQRPELLNLFTDRGAFVTGWVRGSLSKVAQNRLLPYPRGRCAQDGYESLALLPLRSGQEVVGLLQLNARARDQFGADLIEYLEAIAPSLGLAVDRRRSEDSLRASEVLYRQLFQNLLHGFAYCQVIYDGNGTAVDFTYLEVNQAFERLTGLVGVAGRRVSELIPGFAEAAPEVLERYGRIAAGGAPEVFEIDFKPLERWFQVSAYSPERGRFVAFINDLTARKQSERELLLANERYQQAQKLESLGRLAGGVAHDFNNLLTVILSYTAVLRQDFAALSPAAAADLDEIHLAAERARDLTRQLLSFARKQVIHVRPVDLNDVVLGCEKLLRRVLREDVSLELRTSEARCIAHCDPGQIEQVLMNLVINANDAMPRGGRVLIETDGEGEGPAPFGGDGAPTGRWVGLRVGDSGLGMSKEVQAHLFEPFFTTKEIGKGTGLGLATVHGIVSQAGGTIRVESEPGHGTTFHVWLPAVSLAAVALPGPARAAASGGTETILVVEDDVQVRRVTVRTLDRAGYRVLVAGSGAEALEVVGRIDEPPRLVVTDVVMPGLDGWAVVKELRRRHGRIEALFVSGYPQDVLGSRGVLDPSLELLQKPFTADELLSRVRRLLDEAASRAESKLATEEASAPRRAESAME